MTEAPPLSPKPRHARARLRGLRAFRREARGTIAIEVALLLPIAFTFVSLVAMAGQAWEVLGKVSLTAKTLTNMVTMQTSLTASQLTCLIDVAAAVMTPWNTSPLSITVSEVLVNSTGSSATVQWSQAGYNGAARSASSTIAVTSGDLPANSYQILGEVTYVFTPPFLGTSPYTSFTFHRSLYVPVRSGTAIPTPS